MELSDVIDVYQLPAGRAVYAAQQTLPLFDVASAADLRARAQAWLDAAVACHALELRFRNASTLPQYGPAAAELDAQIDRTLGQIDQLVSAHVELAADPACDPHLADSARLLRRELFPRGLTHITLRAYVEELTDVRALLARLTGEGDLAAAAAALPLAPFLTRLARLAEDFAAELAKAPKAEGPGWDAVRAARAELHGAQLRLIATVVGRFPDADATSVATRTHLLEPLLVQQRALKALYRSRRPVVDVDPKTGEVDPAAPSTPATA